MLRPLLYLLAAEAVLLPVLALAARRLGVRRPGWALLGGALAALAPFAVGWATGRTIVPTGDLGTAIPGAPPALDPVDPYDAGQNDVVLQLLPWEIEVRRAFREGRAPFWSDRLGGGSDLWANPQALVASPLAWLARPAPVGDFLLVSFALRLATAFAGMALVARRFGLGRLAALVPALGCAWGGATVGFALFPITAAAAFVPWLALAGAHLARDRSGTGRATTALLAAAACLGGHPVTGAGALLGAAAAALAARRPRASWLRTLGGLALPLAAGVALSAPVNLPFALALGEGEGALVPSAAVAAARPLVPPGARPILTAFVAPFAALPAGAGRAWLPAVSVYSGLWLVPALLAALAFAPRRRLVAPVGLAALILLTALGPGPFLEWKASVPILRSVQIPRLASTALCALALAGGLGLAAAGKRLRRWLAGRHPHPRRARGIAALALATATVVDLGAFLARALPRGDARHLYPATPWTEWLLDEVGAGERGKVLATGYRLYPSLLAAYGLEEARPHNHALEPRRLATALEAGLGFARPSRAYFAAVTRPGHPLLDFLGVRWVVAGGDEPPPGMRARPSPVARAPLLWENSEALPRFFAPRRAALVAEPEIGGWIRALADPWTVALDPAQGGAPTLGSSPATFAGGDGRWRLAAAGDAAAFWASSIPWAPGWRARAGGTALTLRRVDGAFLGIVLPAGAGREVDLVYRPQGLLAGAALAGAGALVLLLARPRRGASRLAARSASTRR